MTYGFNLQNKRTNFKFDLYGHDVAAMLISASVDHLDFTGFN